MSDLQRLTTRYVEREDRIRLTGENEDRGVVTLWLTQRLANRIIGPLCRWLESQAQDSQAASKPSPRMQLEQTFEQERAAQALVPQPPVQPEGTSTESLVESVDVQRGGKGVRLVFKDGQQKILATLTFSSTLTRQWMAIVLGQFKAAQWPLAAWPQWMVNVGRRPEAGETKWH